MGGLCAKQTKLKYHSSISIVMQHRQKIPCYWKQSDFISGQSPDVYLQPGECCILYQVNGYDAVWLARDTKLNDPLRVEYNGIVNGKKHKVIIRRKLCDSQSGATQYAEVYSDTQLIGTLLLKILD